MNIQQFASAIALAAFVAISAFNVHQTKADDGKIGTIILAGGCFWCVESDFDHVPGVVETVSGFTGGHLDEPSYDAVSDGGTGHIEAVWIKFDRQKTSYTKLLDIFWRSVDPTDPGGQFCDRGHSYTTAIFPANEEERKIAEASKKAIEDAKTLSKPIATKILDAGPFHKAEDYHQDYHNKNPVRYRFYRFNCGRDKQVQQVWGDQAHMGIEKH